MDYIIDQPCKVKETLSLDGFVYVIKQKGRPMAIVEAEKQRGKSDEEAQERATLCPSINR